MAVGRVGGGDVPRVSDSFFFFFKTIQVWKKINSFGRGEGKGGLASVSEFVLQRIQI